MRLEQLFASQGVVRLDAATTIGSDAYDVLVQTNLAMRQELAAWEHRAGPHGHEAGALLPGPLPQQQQQQQTSRFVSGNLVLFFVFLSSSFFFLAFFLVLIVAVVVQVCNGMPRHWSQRARCPPPRRRQHCS